MENIGFLAILLIVIGVIIFIPIILVVLLIWLKYELMYNTIKRANRDARKESQQIYISKPKEEIIYKYTPELKRKIATLDKIDNEIHIQNEKGEEELNRQDLIIVSIVVFLLALLLMMLTGIFFPTLLQFGKYLAKAIFETYIII